LDLPRLAAGPGKHLVGLRVIEFMRDRVPLQLLAATQRDHPDVAEDYPAAPDRGIADRLVAELYANDEVLSLVGWPAIVDLRVFLERLRKDLGVAGQERVAADEEGAVFSQDQHAVLVRAYAHGAASIRSDPLLGHLAILIDQLGPHVGAAAAHGDDLGT